LKDGEHLRVEDLELYALGALPDDEAESLKEHVTDCAECSTKLAEAHGNAAVLAFTAPQEQPAGTVKAELMARVRANRESEDRYAWPLDAKRLGRVTNGPGKRAGTSNWLNWMLVPAALALALVSFALSWQNRKLAEQLKKEEQRASIYIQDRKEAERLLTVLASPDTQTVKLVGTSEEANASGVVRYNGRMGTLLYSVDLPALPAGKTYQIWLVPVNGAPIGAGIFGASETRQGRLLTAEVPANTRAKAFAVTIEPAGGVPQPTGPKVLLGTS
jgi:anti-sigma-K factor RskA